MAPGHYRPFPHRLAPPRSSPALASNLTSSSSSSSSLHCRSIARRAPLLRERAFCSSGWRREPRTKSSSQSSHLHTILPPMSRPQYVPIYVAALAFAAVLLGLFNWLRSKRLLKKLRNQLIDRPPFSDSRLIAAFPLPKEKEFALQFRSKLSR